MEDFSIFAKIKADTSDFTKGINNAKSSIESLSGQSFKGLETAIDKVLGPKGKLAIALISVSTLMAKFGQEFNNITNDIIKGTGALGKDLLSLEGSAKKALVNGFGGDLKTVGGIVADLNTRFGVTDKTLERMTLDFDKFARITGADTKQAVSEVADVIAKWGMNLEDTNPLLNQLVVASQQSGASVQELLSGLKSGQAVFSQFGFSATQTIGYLSSLKKNGIDSTTVISSMKIALANLAKQGVEAGEGLKQVTSQIQSAETETEALNIAVAVFGQRNAPEMVRVLRSGSVSAEDFSKSLETAGGTLDKLDKYIITSGQSFKELGNALKGTFSGFGQGFDLLFAGLFDALSSIVRMIEPIITPIANIFKEVFGFVGEILRVTIANISTFVTKYSQGFQTTVNVLTRTYEAVHGILSNILEIFKDSFNVIFAILDGKWALVWEYFKKTMMNSAKIILDVASSIANIFKDMMNQIITGLNKGIQKYNEFVENAEKEHPNLSKIFGLKKGTEISLIGDLDLSKLTGLEGALDKTTQRIKDLSGETEKELIGDLGAVKNVAQDVTQTVEDSGTVINDIIKEARENIEKQKIEWESISAIKGEQISAEEKLAFYEDNLVNVLKESGGLNEQNNAFYEEQLGIIKKIRDNLEKPINNNWKKKIEELRLEGLEENSRAYHAHQLKIINSEESTVLATAQTEEEKSDIRTLYNEKREKENKRFLGIIEEDEKKAREKVIAGLIATANGAINLTKGMVKGMAKAFETIGSVMKKVISGIKSMVSISMKALKKIVDFSIDDSLDALLKFEDGILTFFVETLPKLPKFLESAFNSVTVLLSSLANSLNLSKMEKTFSSIISTITQKAPTTFGNLVTLVSRTFTAIGNSIRNNAGAIVNAFGNMFLSVGNALPSVVDTFFGTVFSLLSNFGLWLTKNKDKIETIVSNVISTVVTNIKEFIKNKGWKRLLTGLLDLQKALESAVSDNIEDIGEVISDALPDLATFLKNSIISASKTVAKVAPTLLKALGEIIGTLFQVAFDPEVIESSFDAIGGIISGLVQAIVAFISKLIPSIIKGLIEAPKAIPELIAGIIGGLIDGLAKADWDKVLEETFQAFIDGFKNLFGINSPSKLFEEFGGYIVEGLEIGLKGFVDVIDAILSPIKTVLDNLTNMKSLGEGLKAVFEGIAEVAKVSGIVTIAIMGAIGQSLADVYNVISDMVEEITSIKIVTPWKTYKVAEGIDLGKIDAPDVQPYIDLITALDGEKVKSGVATVAGAKPDVPDPYKYTNPESYYYGRRYNGKPLDSMSNGGQPYYGDPRYYTNPQSYNSAKVQPYYGSSSNSGNTFNVTFNNVQDTSVYNAVSQLKQYNREMAMNGVL